MVEIFSKTALAFLFPEVPTTELSKEYTFQIQSSGTLHWTADVFGTEEPKQKQCGRRSSCEQGA